MLLFCFTNESKSLERNMRHLGREEVHIKKKQNNLYLKALMSALDFSRVVRSRLIIGLCFGELWDFLEQISSTNKQSLKLGKYFNLQRSLMKMKHYRINNKKTFLKSCFRKWSIATHVFFLFWPSQGSRLLITFRTFYPALKNAFNAQQ